MKNAHDVLPQLKRHGLMVAAEPDEPVARGYTKLGVLYEFSRTSASNPESTGSPNLDLENR